MTWTKRVRVPSLYIIFAASYRYGFTEGKAGKRAQVRSYFSNEGAWKAYVAGYAAGEIAKLEEVEGSNG